MIRNKNRWWIAPAVAIAVIIAAFFLLRPTGSGTYDNLIRNGDFERVSDGLPSDWYTDAYFPQKSYTDYDLDTGITGNSAHIRNFALNDARFAQTVAVSPATLYRLHGFIKAQADKGLGANLSIEGVYVFSESIYDTLDDWQEVTLYGRTGENQRSVTVYARLGGYSGESTGEAWFDDITLNRVDSVPGGYAETAWHAYAAPAADETTATGTWKLVLSSIAYLILFAVLMAWFRQENSNDLKPKSGLFSLFVVLVLALIVRFIVAATVPGYDVDIACFRGWAAEMATVGPVNFYQQVGFCDYPPGYLWVLWLIGGLGQMLGSSMRVLVKLPPILADVALCALLYTESKRYHLSEKSALALCVLYAFNPLTIVTGAAWGQADAVMLLLIFLVVVYAARNKWSAALPLYMAAVLIKPQALMFGPLGLMALIVYLIDKRKDQQTWTAAWKDALLGLFLLVLTALVMAGPFLAHQEQPISWLVNLYSGTMNQYGYVTVNACNIYFLLGKNWVSASSMLTGESLITLSVFCVAVLPILAFAVMAPHAFKGKENRPRLYPLSGLIAVLAVTLAVLILQGKMTYGALGTVMIVYDVALFAVLFLLNHDIKDLPLLGASLLLVLFNTGAMMHERYLFPAVGLLLLAYIWKKDKRILWLAIGVSITGLLNVGCALDRNIRIGGADGHLSAPAVGIISDMRLLESLSAIGNCLLSAFSTYLCLDLCRHGATVRVFHNVSALQEGNAAASSAPHRTAPAIENHSPRKMTKKDWAILLAVTVLYAVLAFTNLGSTKSPQTAWVSQARYDTDTEGNWEEINETLTIDLGQERTFKALFFPGIHWRRDWESSEFTVQVSSDGETWTGGYEGSVKSGDTFDCFHWKYISDPAVYGDGGRVMTGRYVRLMSQFPELTLYELLLRDAETGEELPILSVTSDIGDNDTVSFLTDEQDTLDGEPSWFNSTYFDEIYHARTAFEHLHGLPVYETTHPPLGKVLMSFAIAIFGMTPFGWRFAGALAGVLMLPGMYLLGKLLIRKKWGGAGAMLLMTFDLMHFTQTRIATIDSFVVLFIIWSVYFMLRWFFLDFFHTDFKKTLIPLGLSGLFMGLAVASKWTGCYAGVGLAVLFFFGIWRRYRETRAAAVLPEKQRTENQTHTADGQKYLLFTILSCLVFFVAVPLLIYYLSYIPYFAFNGGVTVEKIIRAAEGMLSYHSQPGLGMNHDFYSPWYQWPVIAKPMWYYAGSFEPAGTASTIMALGNPAVWWTGLVGLIGVLALFIRRHYDEKHHVLSLYAWDDDPRYAVLLICFMAQYLPWVLVPRGTYIYHYFPSVPFIILCTEMCIEKLSERHEKAARLLLYGLILAAAALFIAFFPYASGVTVSTKWLEAMRWFPRWLWY